ATQEEAGEAYDIAAIKFRGANAVTNFDITKYDVEKIIASNNLLNSEEAKRNRKMDDLINIEEAINPMQKSSREQSPENRTSLPMLFGMTSTESMSSFSLPQMPLSVFAAWNDAA
ncbi:ap2-like ethylene-responsive transcription factor ant-like protein, partial [Trifolium pratense]